MSKQIAQRYKEGLTDVLETQLMCQVYYRNTNVTSLQWSSELAVVSCD